MPTIQALAQADERQVLRLWEGLGYYHRARQLHQAARQIVSDYDGQFPSDPQLVQRLPGIGRYTAGAILSIAMDQRRPILEANTVRVFSRLLAYGGQTTSSAGQKLLWAAAQAVLPTHDVGRFNQALMELGGKVCRPRAPACEVCPAAGLCRAQLRGLQNEIPSPKPRPQFEEVSEAAVLVRRRGRVLLIQWPEGRRWAGLWDFPRFVLQGNKEDQIQLAIVDNVRRLTGVTVVPGVHRKTLRHGVTRFRITLDCYDAEYVSHNGGGAEYLVQTGSGPPSWKTIRSAAPAGSWQGWCHPFHSLDAYLPAAIIPAMASASINTRDTLHPAALNICYGGADCLVNVCGLAMEANQGNAIAHNGRAIIASGFKKSLSQVVAQVSFRYRNNGKIELYCLFSLCTMLALVYRAPNIGRVRLWYAGSRKNSRKTPRPIPKRTVHGAPDVRLKGIIDCRLNVLVLVTCHRSSPRQRCIYHEISRKQRSSSNQVDRKSAPDRSPATDRSSSNSGQCRLTPPPPIS